MKITVRYYGPFKEKTGRDEELLFLEEGALVKHVLKELENRHGFDFGECRDGMHCLMKEGRPGVAVPEERLQEGSVLVFVGIVDSG